MPLKDKAALREYQNNWTRQRRQNWIDSQGGKCCECGSSDRLEVDHIDPTKKVSHRVFNWSYERREVELAKCQVLCHECHLKKTVLQTTVPDHLIHGRAVGYELRKCRCEKCKLWKKEKNKKRYLK
jgi:5-methylcytosine-specific restriction endonuclease McrA